MTTLRGMARTRRITIWELAAWWISEGEFQISLVSAFLSRSAVAPTINGFDNTGTNYSSTGYTSLLGILGKGYADFLSKSELEDLVKQYNTTYAGTLTPAGKAGLSANQRYPVIMPARRLSTRRHLHLAGPPPDQVVRSAIANPTACDR